MPWPEGRINYMLPHMPAYSLGIDEAGRGCVLGPLVVAVVLANEKDRRWFREWNVRDSKRVPPKERTDLAERIKERCWFELRIAHPPMIDAAIADRSRTLNGLEMEMMADLLRAYQQMHTDRPARALIDAPSINARAFRDRLQIMSGWTDTNTLRAEHHADVLDRTVSAASILAKDERERLLALIKKALGVDFGSGYCHDARTIAHLKAAPQGAAYVRWSWATAQRMMK
jgi:ribonuclease HII